MTMSVDISFRPLPALVDEIAEQDPNRDHVGVPDGRENLAYVGANDLRYTTFVLACAKTNHRALLLSPRTSKVELQHLMNLAGCDKFIYSKEREAARATAAQASDGWSFWPIPAFDEMLSEQPVKKWVGVSPHIYTLADCCFFVHTSGTTGLPKLVPITYGYLDAIDRTPGYPTLPGRRIRYPSQLLQGRPYLAMFPFFHVAGVMPILQSIFHANPFILCQDQPMSVERMRSCLTRDGSAAAQRIRHGLEQKSLPFPSNIPVDYLQANLDLPDLGLSADIYRNLLESVNLVIHNAWEVNFIQRLEAFEHPHIQGTRHLVDFCLASRSHAQLHFISSISSAGSWSAKHDSPIPEEIIHDPEVPLIQGYGQSKFVAEHICAQVALSSGLPVTVYRVGQICGPTAGTGVWNKKEWVPSLIETSIALGCISDSLGSAAVDWIPVDTAARIITELIDSRSKTGESALAVFNLVNPRVSEWEDVIAPIQSRYGLEKVTFEDWIARLQGIKGTAEEDLEKLPALKILEFYQGLSRSDSVECSRPARPFVTEAGEQQSASFRDLEAVTSGLMGCWLDRWGYEDKCC
ncbi:NAD(P)-binding protein [Aspergillus homomorphus CBS 101889]|uniref:NAD(P)-binding protein n=1 Tax=Aspergillus homomorphus (strain CBS 101889) TaxID=1450537 RepID=A0A395HJI3_ASPHC|nr:NAD(P)-binding protein [Aspergillus homomorphus CBS 101889]RAL07786.1 NAD(P)-binding protein [Aspergillus homomorphus CBS 101889]